MSPIGVSVLAFDDMAVIPIATKWFIKYSSTISLAGFSVTMFTRIEAVVRTLIFVSLVQLKVILLLRSLAALVVSIRLLSGTKLLFTQEDLPHLEMSFTHC